MRIETASISGVLFIEPELFIDDRGFFTESFNQQKFNKATGLNALFVQDNHSYSSKGVLRGMHYQIQHTQEKLIWVVRGEIFAVVIDIRKSSSTFGQWLSTRLSGENHRQIWVPKGFAHGFLVLSEVADVLYKTTNYYCPEFERCILWNDSTLDIQWPLFKAPQLSVKDQAGCMLVDAETFP